MDENAADHLEQDNLSMSTNFSNSSTELGLDNSESSLAQAFGDFSVKMDREDDNVLVSMDVPSDIPASDLTVQVDAGILRVTGDVSNERTVEQAFQLDEQSLLLRKMTAKLSDGVLTIKTPMKDAEDSTLAESIPIDTKRAAPVDDDTFKVIVDVPGVHLEDIHASYANGKLRIAANRHFGRVRSFKRTINLDTQKFDADRLQAHLHKGQLIVLVPPKEMSVLSTIKIQTNSDEKETSI